MANINAHGDTPGEHRPPVNEVAPDGTPAVIEKNLAADIITAVTATPALVAGIRYGFQSLDNRVTQQAETQREQIRQDGETVRAIVAAQTPPPSPPEPPQQ
ncbi:hypothetical protein ACFXGR_28555 [Streptomyces mirabilis]|uniref:hypothetical protein n=1 Tax=Streptomyces mirabilis TaxID=68239 RepID=UPI00368649B1